MTTTCTHHFVIDGLEGTCKLCGFNETYPAPVYNPGWYESALENHMDSVKSIQDFQNSFESQKAAA